MESQADSQLVEQIEPKVAALAAVGRRRWEPVRIDINLLTGVPLVQNRLDELDTGDRANPDAKLKAIGDALKAAIHTLPNPYREAALDHFGFTDKDSGDPSNQGEREHRAAKAWGYGGGWYRRRRQEYFGMKTSEYVITLATCAFCGIADPIAYIARREGVNAETVPNRPQEDQNPTSDGVDASNATDAASGELATLGATMVSREPGHLEVFWVGPNNEVFYRWLEDGHDWSWDSWDEPAAISLTAVSRGPGDEVLFGLSPDGRVWYRVWELKSQGWYAAGDVQWLDDNEIVRGPLASANRGQDMIELFAFDVDGQPWHRWTEGGMSWSPWTHWSIG
ncbi:MAG: hypothetical protein WB998_12835 [Solirubrobacteraceae bacterium]